MNKGIGYDHPLDSKLALSLIGKETPNDLIISKDFITRIGNLCDVNFIRKLNISFNNIKTLDGIDQLSLLKELYAYSCNLSDINNIRSNSKLEIIMLQQNNITKISESFLQLIKIQELRLDQNRIVKIENLSACINIKKLDLSFNGIEQLTGLHTLQHLTELKVSNNLIRSISTIKSLPSIKEIDVSYNQLRNLDGLHQLPTLEVFNANHNMISELKILPSYSNKQLKQQDNMKSTTTVSHSYHNDTNKSISKTINQKNVINNTTTTLPDLPKVVLNELYLTGNRIRTTEGLEHLSKCLEILDISSNNLSIEAGSDLVKSLEQCNQLTELRIHGNVCIENESFVDNLIKCLSFSCKKLRAIDGMSFVDGIASSDYTSTSHTNSVFHTWNDDASGIFENNNEFKSIADTDNEHHNIESNKEVGDDELVAPSDSDDSEYEKKKKVVKDVATAINNNPTSTVWILKPMLSEDEIISVAANFRNRLQDCKNKLAASTSIFDFANKDNENIVEEGTVVDKQQPVLLVHSESGMRVAAALDKAATSVVIPPNNQSVVATVALTTVNDTAQIKEKLVDRVRQVVSSNASVIPTNNNNNNNNKTAAVMEQSDDKKNSPLLTDDIRNSSISDYKQSSNNNNQQDKCDNNSLNSLPKRNNNNVLKAPSKNTATNVNNSNNSNIALSMKSINSQQTTNLGSGLTRYGSRITPHHSTTTSNISNNNNSTNSNNSINSNDTTIVSSNSMMNILHTNLDNFSMKETENIDLTNMKLIKQNHKSLFLYDLSPDKNSCIFENDADYIDNTNNDSNHKYNITNHNNSVGYDARVSSSLGIMYRTDSDSALTLKNTTTTTNPNIVSYTNNSTLSSVITKKKENEDYNIEEGQGSTIVIPQDMYERRHSEPHIMATQKSTYSPRNVLPSPSNNVMAHVVKSSYYQNNTTVNNIITAVTTPNTIHNYQSNSNNTIHNYQSNSNNTIHNYQSNSNNNMKELSSKEPQALHKMKFQIPKKVKDLINNNQIEKEILNRSIVKNITSCNPTIGHSIININDDSNDDD